MRTTSITGILAFADIMQDGGFDAVLGNPPWEVSQLNEEEWFASRAPSIASLAGTSCAKTSLIAKLREDALTRSFGSSIRNALHDYNAEECLLPRIWSIFA